MKKRSMIYSGKAKNLYEGPDEDTLIQYFKDDATAFNKKKHEILEGKGVLNNFISAFIMGILEQAGIPTHFIKRLNMREQLVRKMEIVPLEVVIRRKAAGSLVKRYGLIKDGEKLPAPLVEFFYKNDEKDDPLITPEAIIMLQICDEETLDDMVAMTMEINHILYGLFAAIGLDLIDMKLEFGLLEDNDFEGMYHVYLADEISPDNCRLRCIKTGESFDKDVFRNQTGSLTDAYTEVARRLGLLPDIQKFSDNKIVKLHADIKKNIANDDKGDDL
jgi:phosphoribosylaminoimidazole-succinocarboxamide synthase